MILIVTHDADETGLAVADRLAEASRPFLRIDPSRLGAENCYSIDPATFGEQWFASLRDGFGHAADLARDFDTIYWRRPLRLEDQLKFKFPLATDVAAVEAYHAFRLAAEALPAERFPLGHPLRIEHASNKLLQLDLARRTGFEVPDTLVGNDPLAHAVFLKRHPQVVVKPLHATASYRSEDRAVVEQLLWCRGIAAESLLPLLANDKPAQMLIQQAVPKRVDWRITVLPGTTICCEIDTSGLPPGDPDWRKKTLELPHRIIDLPADFERRLRAYLGAIDLPAGYFDFAVAGDGTPWFLEMNTNAQWLWIEEMTGCSISAVIADCLAR